MMMPVHMNVHVISRETIKPSSPTPHHLKSFKFSLLDQVAIQSYVPVVLYYPMKGDFSGVQVKNAERSNRLKESLSDTLSLFYPLAGRIEDKPWVDCNDQGVEYSETRVDCHLSEVVRRPEMELIDQFLPLINQSSGPSVGDALVAIRVNNFDCGGMAIGINISHRIADASSIGTFITGWAATAREAREDIICPRFNSASLFPPIDLAGFKLNFAVATEKTVTKRFTIDATKITALKAKVADSFYAIQPTRVEAVSALLWKCFIAIGVESKSSGQFVASHAVNIRGRMVPPVPEQFGNLLQLAIVPLTVEKGATELGSLVSRMRHEVRKFDCDYIRKLQNDNGISMFNYINEFVELSSKGGVAQFCNFSSWCRLPFYEADFGWGKPVWVSTASGDYNNYVILMDSRYGDGIEIWVTMEDQDMAKFESDPELLAFVSST